MSFSVGVLYSAVSFIEMLEGEPIRVDDFRKSFDRYIVANADEVLKVSQKCSWIVLNSDGYIYATDYGKKLLGYDDLIVPLRLQISDLITIDQPAWAKRMRHGRAEVKKYMTDDVKQCFMEAGLFDEWENDLINWWDSLALKANAQRSVELLEIGRKAERLTIEYEEKRTGVKPKWQSLESNFSGFDVISRFSDTDNSRLMIEVKGSMQKKRDAHFYLTKNEWSVAVDVENYEFHLWLLGYDPPELIKASREAVEGHLPSNNGQGTWETVRVPFSL